jgi:tripartite-type tricarboxylate transporter receptor subunit TctC
MKRKIMGLFFKTALNDSETQAVLNKFDMFTIYLGPEDLEKASQEEFEHIGNIVRKLGLQKK